MDASKTMWKLDLACELRAVKSPQEKTEGGKEKQRAEEAEQKAPDVQKESRQKTRGVDRTEARRRRAFRVQQRVPGLSHYAARGVGEGEVV